MDSFKAWMSETARTKMPHAEMLHTQLKDGIENIAKASSVEVGGNLLIDANALFNHNLISQEQFELTIRALHAVDDFLSKADLTDSDYFTVQSIGMMAINALAEVPASKLKTLL